MGRTLLFLACLLISFPVVAQEKIKVVVLDTGLNLKDPRFSDVLCEDGHKDFTWTGIKDVEGHGTAIVSLIKQYAGNTGYCLLIYKYYTKTSNNVFEYLSGLQNAMAAGARFINFSGGGNASSSYEKNLIINHPEVTYIVAAGNDGKELNVNGYGFFPASYGLNNIIVVGNTNEFGERVPSSNYGSIVSAWEDGFFIPAASITGTVKINGTSASCAVRTGKLIKQYLDSHK